MNLAGKRFFCDDNSDEIYCEKHYEAHATRCDTCGKFITGSVVNKNGKHYHHGCLNGGNAAAGGGGGRQRAATLQKAMDSDDAESSEDEAPTPSSGKFPPAGFRPPTGGLEARAASKPATAV